MKRRLFKRVIVFLLLGAIVNVAVAWACAAFSDPDLGNPQHLIDDSELERTRRQFGSQQSDLFQTSFRTQYCGRGIVMQMIIADSPKQLPGFQSVASIFSGLPCQCMRGSLFQDARQTCFQSAIDIRVPPSKPFRVLPLRPAFPGFALNTIFYAATLWLLFAAPGVVRRRIRAKRGQCPACAYPIGTSEVCTECGKPLPGVPPRRGDGM